MSHRSSGSVLWQLRSLFGRGSLAGHGDGRLIERFVAHGDEEAFEALMARHGPMVLGVCRRALDDPRDVEDAFQATFLLLVKKAGTLRDSDLLANWLYGVAYRVASHARANAYRRRLRERPGGEEVAVSSEPRENRAELRAVLDDELARLPDRLRTPVVLCDLEGLPQDEAARRIGCPVGTIKSRLSRGRERLRVRLVRRGVVPSAIVAEIILLTEESTAAVPASLRAYTLQVASRFASGAAVAAPTAALVEGVMRSMIMTKIRTASTAFLALSLITASAATLVATVAPGERQNVTRAPVAGAKQAETRTPVDPGRQATRTLTLTVIGKGDKKPVAGTAVERRTFDQPNSLLNLLTDADGRCPVPIPAGDQGEIEIGAFRDGFVPASISRSPAELGGMNPLTAALELDPATPVGGIVRDESGRPIVGARIIPWFVAEKPSASRSFFVPESGVATTDADGRWRASILPTNASGRILMRLMHPDYVSEPGGFSQSVTVEQARAMSGVMIMKEGFAVAGSVIGPEGQAIQGAAIVVPLSASQGDWFRTATDALGKFRLPHVEDRAGRGVLQVRAEAAGFAPAWVQVEARRDAPPVMLRLTKGRPFVGRVVDAKGQPIFGARVSVNAWEECRNLDWRGETDAVGRFTWANAPKSGEILFVVRKAGYAQAFGHKLSVSDPNPIITLNRPVRVRGSVVDAETGRPIDTFNVVPGETWEGRGDNIHWWRDSRVVRGVQGRYQYSSDLDQAMTRYLRIEATGYRPSVSRAISEGEGEIVIDFTLRKGVTLPNVAGVVRLPDNKPLAGAEVYLATQSKRLDLKNGRPIPELLYRDMKVETGPDGRFSFKDPGERAAIVVLHDRGFAQRDVAELAGSPDVTLEAWGRIEGTIRVGGKPGAKEIVNVEDYRSIRLEVHSQAWNYGSEVDENGHFVIERVMPSETAIVDRRVPWRLGRLAAASTPPFAIKPGETVRVELGGAGRPFVGRVIAPADEGPAADLTYARGKLTLKLPKIPVPEGFASWTDRRQREFMNRFWELPEGRARLQKSRSYSFKVSPDGSFRVEDVSPGAYELAIEALAHIPPYEPIATAQRDLSVAEIPGGRTDEPLDIGELRLVAKPTPSPRKGTTSSVKSLKVGQPAPSFTVTTLDGKPLKLEDYRGKIVLLDFWATWCLPCREQEPSLKAVFAEFGKDPRFVMIGLSLDDAPDVPKAFAAKHNLQWTQGFLGDWSETRVPSDYGVSAIPQIMLIGPEAQSSPETYGTIRSATPSQRF